MVYFLSKTFKVPIPVLYTETDIPLLTDSFVKYMGRLLLNRVTKHSKSYGKSYDP